MRRQLKAAAAAAVNQTALSVMPGGNPVQAVACGKDHMVLLAGAQSLDDEARGYSLYTLGAGAHGCLGHGDKYDCAAPMRVAALSSHPVLSIACGEYHTCCIDANGSLWSWGKGAAGSLGHGDTADCLYPTQLEFLQHDPIRTVACGSNHTVAASHRGFAYTWGWGEQGRLGLGDEEGRLTPELVETLAAGIVEVACGASHTLFLDSEGIVYGCGWNDYGQVCDPMSMGVLEPVEIPIGTGGRGDLPSKPCKMVRCGFGHSAALTANDELYLWGFGEEGQLGLGNETTTGRPTRIEALDGLYLHSLSLGHVHSLTIVGKERQSKSLYIARKRRDEQLFATRLQRAVRRWLCRQRTRKDAADRRRERDEAVFSQQNAAATMVQAHVRACLARMAYLKKLARRRNKELAKLQACEAESRRVAATTLQTSWRVFVAKAELVRRRRALEGAEVERARKAAVERAARGMQRWARGEAGRRVARVKQLDRQQMAQAALTIQCAWWAAVARRRTKQIRRRRQRRESEVAANAKAAEAAQRLSKTDKNSRKKPLGDKASEANGEDKDKEKSKKKKPSKQELQARKEEKERREARREARLQREREAKEAAELEAEQQRLEEEQKRKRAAQRRLKAEREKAKVKLGIGFDGGVVEELIEGPDATPAEEVSDEPEMSKPTFSAFVETKKAAKAGVFVEDSSLDHLRSNVNAHRRLAGKSFGRGTVVRTQVTGEPTMLRSASAGNSR